MKTCQTCGIDKPLSEFNKRKNGYQHKCRDCQKAWYKNYYDTNPKERIRAVENSTRHRGEQREMIRSIKNKPCYDCKNFFPYYVMDFDHLGDKSFNIGSSLHKSKQSILDEISKCEVICSNCHRIRTYKRANGIPLVGIDL